MKTKTERETDRVSERERRGSTKRKKEINRKIKGERERGRIMKTE